MDLMRIPLFEALTKRMAWLNDRQAVLAQNVANADTPGYAARDLKPPDFRSLLQQTQKQVDLVATQPGHIAIHRSETGVSDTASAADRTINGNGVSLEEQMMKVSQTANDFALTSTLYRANLSILKMVLGRGS